MSSFTFTGSFARVRMSGRLILSRGISRIAGPPDFGFENGTPVAAPYSHRDTRKKEKTKKKRNQNQAWVDDERRRNH